MGWEPINLPMSDWVMLAMVGLLGHVMAAFWFAALRFDFRICKRVIYDLPFQKNQLKREAKNSLHAPMHAALLALFMVAGNFEGTGHWRLIGSFMVTMVVAEIWHYASHRAFHTKALHWIHAEHHKSRLCTPLTALSFSFWEKLIFDLGLLAILALMDRVWSLNAMGIAVWFGVYLVVNSLGHANFEIQSKLVNRLLAPVFTTTTYHALHHSRYTGHYGLSTRFMDKVFGTEWEDYERVFNRVVEEGRPMEKTHQTV